MKQIEVMNKLVLILTGLLQNFMIGRTILSPQQKRTLKLSKNTPQAKLKGCFHKIFGKIQ